MSNVVPRCLVYRLDSGEILQVAINVPEDMIAAQAGPGQGVLVTAEGDGGARWYAPGGVLTRRPRLAFTKWIIAADGADVARLEIGEPFEIAIDGETFAVEEGFIELSADMPARYRVEVDHFPWLPLDAEILAQ
jgi:hypothetical protein